MLYFPIPPSRTCVFTMSFCFKISCALYARGPIWQMIRMVSDISRIFSMLFGIWLSGMLVEFSMWLSSNSSGLLTSRRNFSFM